jgi:uncharacterized protein
MPAPQPGARASCGPLSSGLSARTLQPDFCHARAMENTRADRDQATGAAPGPADSLTAEHCWQLLASSRVARVAFVEDGLPQLAVMNHLPQGHDLLFQTNEDSRLAARTDNATAVPVAVEVDSASAAGRTGWSVIATGTLSRTTAVAGEGIPVPWRPEAVGVLLRMTVDQIDGRHVGTET